MSNKIQKLIAALVRPAQSLENAMWDVLTKRSIDAGEGVQLDTIGKIVGQPRNGLDDATYRRYLRARVATNKSNGSMEDLITIGKLVIADAASKIRMTPYYPATILQKVEGVAVSNDVANDLITFLKDGVGSGIRIFLSTSEDVPAEMFTFARSSFLTEALVGGETVVKVVSTDKFDATGSLIIDEATPEEETVSYTGKTSTQFIGVSPAIANAHPVDTSVKDEASPGKGFNEGKLSSVRIEAVSHSEFDSDGYPIDHYAVSNFMEFDFAPDGYRRYTQDSGDAPDLSGNGNDMSPVNSPTQGVQVAALGSKCVQMIRDSGQRMQAANTNVHSPTTRAAMLLIGAQVDAGDGSLTVIAHSGGIEFREQGTSHTMIVRGDGPVKTVDSDDDPIVEGAPIIILGTVDLEASVGLIHVWRDGTIYTSDPEDISDHTELNWGSKVYQIGSTTLSAGHVYAADAFWADPASLPGATELANLVAKLPFGS